MTMMIMNLVTHKVAAEHEILYNKPVHGGKYVPNWQGQSKTSEGG